MNAELSQPNALRGEGQFCQPCRYIPGPYAIVLHYKLKCVT